MKHLLYSACLLCMMAQAEQAMGQNNLVSKDSANAHYPGYENAFDHLLQKPIRIEKFEHKKFGDHLFLMGGMGLNYIKTQEASPSVQISGMLGDWVTPVHGWRVGMHGGLLDYGEARNKFIGLSADYLMNLHALGSGQYSLDRPFEISLLAGVDAIYARKEGLGKKALGVHAGFLGSFRLSHYTFLFVEPKLGLYSNGITPRANYNSWRSYKMMPSITAGLGYKLMTGHDRYWNVYQADNFWDHFFVSVGAGVATVVARPLSNSTDYLGGFGSLAVGKEVSPYSSFRAKLKASMLKADTKHHLKVLNGQIDYLFNLTNIMSGYKTDRKLWLNGVIGVDLAASKYEYTKFMPGVGGGAQLNFSTGRYSSFYLEPRLDVYGKNFSPVVTSFRSLDVVASLEAGMTFYRNAEKNRMINSNSYHTASFWDGLFVQGALGVSTFATKQAFTNPSDQLQPMAYAGIGKWFTDWSGIRLAADVRKYRLSSSSPRKNMATGGVDYLFNFSNFIAGYNPDRRAEIFGAAGLRLGMRSESKKLYPGVSAGLQGVWHLNPMFGLFIEPTLQGYSNDFALGGIHVAGMGFMGSVMAGVNLRMRGYDIASNRRLYNNDLSGNHGFVYMAGGFNVRVNNLRNPYWNAKAGYGYWFSPMAAWRLNMETVRDNRYARNILGVDWMVDITSLAYGFNSDRVVSLRGYMGAAMGMEYQSWHSAFSPDIHVGGQMEVKVSPQIGIFAEPQITGKIITESTAGKPVSPQFSTTVGLNYYFDRKSNGNSKESDNRHFASLSLGSGIYYNGIKLKQRGAFAGWNVEGTFGKWESEVSGWQLGLGTHEYVMGRNRNRRQTTLTADYLVNFSRLMDSNRDKGFQLIGVAGLTGNKERLDGKTNNGYSVGLDLGVQGNIYLSPNFDLFIQPGVNIMNRSIERNDRTAIDGKLMLGLKYKW